MSGSPSSYPVRDVWFCPYTLFPRNEAGRWNARTPARPIRGVLIRAGGGFGCIHPWPELGDPSLDAVLESIRAGRPDPLAVRALECAAADGAARAEGRSLFAGLTIPRSHATVTDGAGFAALRAEGFTVCKIKGGTDFRQVLEAAAAAVRAGLRVRIDFNGVLTPSGAAEFLRQADGLRGSLDCIEDPCPWEEDTWRRLEEEFGVPLALDFGADGAAAWNLQVVKPARRRVPDGVESVIFTSAMDHPVGQLFAAWEAARFPGRQADAGLLTHRLIAEDAFTERLGNAGPDLRLPGGTGLGFDDLLERLAWRPAGRTGHRIRWNPKAALPGTPPDIPPDCEGFATSGSGGLPRIVVLTRSALEASARAAAAFLNLSARDVWLRVLPDFHVAGFQIATRAAVTGSRVVSDDGRWDPRRFRDLCVQEGVTHTSLVPAQVHDLAAAGIPAPPQLQAVLVGGGALPEPVRTSARALGWPVLVSYGMTETASFVAAATTPDSAELTLLPEWTAGIHEPAADGSGTLELAGPSLCLGWYAWNGRDWEWTAHPAGEPLRTADRARLHGRILTLLGRADRVVKILGELVDCDAVEARLAAAGLAPGSFAVATAPDERAGHRLLLISEAGVPEDVLGRYHRTAPPFARISGVATGVPLPRSALGKILRGRLDELLAAGITRPSGPG